MVTNTTVGFDKRRHLKFGQILKQHAAAAAETTTRSSRSQDDFNPSSTQTYTTYYVETTDGLAYKVMVPEQTTTPSRSQYFSSFPYHVELALEEYLKSQVIYEKVQETVYQQIKLLAGKVAQNNFSAIDEEQEEVDYYLQQDRGAGEMEDIHDADIDDGVHYFSGRVARLVESHVGMAASFLHEAIQEVDYSKPSPYTVIDLLGVVDLVVDQVTCDMVTEKICDLIYDTLFETVSYYYSKTALLSDDDDRLMNELQEEARFVADFVVDATSLVVDDTLTTLLANAFNSMCDASPNVYKSRASHDVVMENVAKKVSEMQIDD